MESSPNAPLRPWRDIARELVNEKNHQKSRALAEELCEAIAQQGMNTPPNNRPRMQAPGASRSDQQRAS